MELEKITIHHLRDISMNICKQFKCITCETIIDCRIGMSNRDIQPFQFACPECEEQITFVFGTANDELTGAIDILNFKGPFQGENHFIDLHIDFPVAFGKYEMGDTAFFRAFHAIGEESFGHLNLRLDTLNKLHSKQTELRRLITQYKRNDIQAFEKVLNSIDFPSIKLKSHKKQDVLAALYSATSIMSSPFTIHEHNGEISDNAPKIIHWLHDEHNENTVKFIKKITSNNFLNNLHYDCIGLYPKMLGFDLPVRPALFYDYIEMDDISKSPARVSSADFDVCNNFYKDLAEVFSRLLTLVAGIDNLLNRGDSDLFDDSMRLNKKNKLIKEFTSLDNFSDLDLGRKIEAINDSFYNVDANSIDNKLRNGIAHYKYEYKESTQLIKYYPRKEGMNRETYHEIYFLEFMRKTLLLFREVHSLNHIVKALLYYCVLVLKIDI